MLRTVSLIDDAARQRPLSVGRYQVSADMLPGLLLTAQDSDAAYADLSAQVSALHGAAQRHPVTPPADLASKLALYVDPAVLPELNESATTANQCADRAAPRDPRFYYRDIRSHLAAEPFYGPLFRHITPCAFWPVSPIEPPAKIGNDHPVLIVSASGDPATPYAGQLVMHHALRGSRTLTLDGAFLHGVYLLAGNPCVDRTVQRYLLGGALPRRDIACRQA